MKIYSFNNPDYYFESKNGKIDTRILKREVLEGYNDQSVNELADWEDVDTLIDMVDTFGWEHPYAQWVGTYAGLANKLTESTKVPDRGFWKKHKYQKLSQDESDELEENLLLSTNFSKDFTVVDVESTGLNTQLDSIIQFSAVKYRNFKEVDSLDLLISPSNGESLSELVTNITGITNEDLEGKPTFESQIPTILDFLGDDILVGHNFNYDLAITSSELERANYEPLRVKYFDTLKLSRKHIPYLGRGEYKLEKLKNRLPEKSLGELDSHNSLNDARITGALYTMIANLDA